VGVGVGGAAVILLLLLAVYFFRRRRKAIFQEGAPAPVPEAQSMMVAELPVVELPGSKKQQRDGLYEIQG
jgi:MYXO-CTERM domain-containing protein